MVQLLIPYTLDSEKAWKPGYIAITQTAIRAEVFLVLYSDSISRNTSKKEPGYEAEFLEYRSMGQT